MSTAFAIAASGLAVAGLRLNVSANNVANMLSSGPLPDADTSNAIQFPAAYAPLRVNQVAGIGGTVATVTTISPSYVSSYDPSAPYADNRGMVAAPNVDLGNEIIQQMIASYTAAANAAVMQVDSQMTNALLNVTA